MLQGSTCELLKKNLLSSRSSSGYLLPYQKLAMAGLCAPKKEVEANDNRDMAEVSRALMEVAARCQGMSGRTIRKIPFLALVKMEDEARPETIEDFMQCLMAAVTEQIRDREAIAEAH